ncbi:MAG: hypothetical protein PHC97_01680 [Patescibacteria group bacterium]|nr:hypothetical protein [Patescibacteria group bacterium]
MNKFWFRTRKGIKSKDLGWGFIPVSWEGIVAYSVLLVLVILFGAYFDILHANTAQGFYFLFSIVILFFAFSVLAKVKTQR